MSRRIGSWALMFGVVVVAFALACSSSNNGYQTGPGGGGGGGGGGVELNSGNIVGCGGMFAHTFNTAGTFQYHCTYHPSLMMGKIFVVASGGPAAPTVNITNYAFSPDTLTIHVGATVTWTNNACSGSPPYQTGTTHTVTTY